MIEVPEEIEEYISKFKSKEIEDEEEIVLLEWIDENIDEVKSFVKDRYDYNETQYNRLMRHRKNKGIKTTKKVDTAEELEGHEKKDLKEFIENNWKDIKRIGTKARMEYLPIARDMGYINEEGEEVNLEKFMDEAVSFFAQQRPIQEELQARAKRNAAVARTAVEALRRAWKSIYAIQSYIHTLKQTNPQIGVLLSGLEEMLPTGGEQSERTTTERRERARNRPE